MADISQIKLPSNETYYIKDATARASIEAIQGAIAGGVVFRGVTTTAITDEATTSSYIVGSKTLTAQNGDLVVYNKKEFLYSTSTTPGKWYEMGDNSAFKALAYADTATGSFQPHGSVAVQTATTANQTTTVAPTSGDPTYTPDGTISAPSWTGTQADLQVKIKPEGTVTFSDSNRVLAVSGTVVSAADIETATYTPAGTVNVTLSKQDGGTTTIKSVSETQPLVAKTVVAAEPGATAPANAVTYYAVSDETLSFYQLGYTTGNAVNADNVIVKTSDPIYTLGTPSFTGTAVRLVTEAVAVPNSATFAGVEKTAHISYTPNGTISAPTFTGTGVRLVTGNIAVPATYSATFTGTSENVTVSPTP